MIADELTPVEGILTPDQLPEFLRERDHMNAILRSRNTAIKAREIELQWLSSHAEVLEQNAGKWIALKGERLVAADNQLSCVIDQAMQLGIEKPILLFIPSKPNDYLLGASNQAKR